jgi:hypothetical protein
MSGNRGVGIRVVSDESVGGIEMGAIPEAPAAIAETIYVGRASFHMQVEHETGETAALALVVPEVAPNVDSEAWFHETPAPAHERTAIIDFSSRLRATADQDGIPSAYGSASSGEFGSRKLITSRWSLGLPLLFGAFFCGLLLSPLASSSFSFSRRDPKGANVPAVSPTMTTSTAPSVAAPLPPSTPPSAPAAPVIAPIAPIEPPRAGHSNLVAGIFAGRSTGGALTPVWGRAMKKNSLRKATLARRPAHGAVVATAAAPTKYTWVDPWAEN